MASLRTLAIAAFRSQREVDHQDGILLHDADQQNNPDQRDDAQIRVREHQCEYGADAGRTASVEMIVMGWM